MKVLLAPLHWGLGHAARTAALIDIFLEASIECAVASDGAALDFLRRHYADRLDAYFELPAYPVVYDENIVAFSVLKRAGGFFKAIQRERKKLAALAEEEQWDLVISDNRYGANIPGIPSIFLGHQLSLKTQIPALDGLATAVNQYFIRSFDQLWIPDFPNHLLSGELSHSKDTKRLRFIGPLHKHDLHSKSTPIYERVVVLSGPEPSRTQWEKCLLSQLENCQESTLLVRGLPGDTETPALNNKHVDVVNFMTKIELNAAISSAEVLIGRAGYSTIMDLCFLRKPAILIPTPGQTEQEYLARHLKGRWPMAFLREKEFDLNRISPLLSELKARNYPDIDMSDQSEKVLELIQSLSG